MSELLLELILELVLVPGCVCEFVVVGEAVLGCELGIVPMLEPVLVLGFELELGRELELALLSELVLEPVLVSVLVPGCEYECVDVREAVLGCKWRIEGCGVLKLS